MDKVTSGVELAKVLDVPLDEGVVVAMLPTTIDEVDTVQLSLLDKKGEPMHGVFANFGQWGRRMIDLQAPSGEDIKWWRVKQAAGSHNLVPVRYEGPISEIPAYMFERDDAVIAVRFYQHGPFFFPKEKPTMTNSTIEAAFDAIEESVAG